MKLKICLMGLLCLYIRASGRQTADGNRSLGVGDTVPDIFLPDVLNYHSSTARLSDFKGKPLILDFWATWCTSCLNHFSGLDSAQRLLNGKVQILLVNTRDTRDDKASIISALDRFNKSDVPFALPTVYDDTVLNAMFRHFQLPHVVWIDAHGVVRAITGGEEVNTASLERFMQTAKTPAHQKRDFDPKRPLYTDEALPLGALQQYSIFLKGKTDGIGQGGLRRINDTVRGLIAHNQSLYWIYSLILNAKIPGLNDNRLVVEVQDPSRFHFEPGGKSRLEWERQNDYSYELIVPQKRVDSLYDDALADLNRFTDYRARIVKREENCWVLDRTKKSVIPVDTAKRYVNELTSPLDARLSGATLFSLCIFINKIGGGKLIVLDDTGFKENVNIDFKQPVASISALQQLLPRFGLVLYQAKRNIAMMVVSDKSINHLNPPQ